MFPHMHEKKYLNYDELIIIVKQLCSKFYDPSKKMFNSNVKTRDDEKDIIYSFCKINLSKNFKFNENELQKSVAVCVDEINIRNYSSSMLPPK